MKLKLGLFLAASCAALQFSALGAGATYSNPVMCGDFPDPSLIRVGKDFYATATSSEWGPNFPLLHSRDMVNWEVIGSVFTKRPDWAEANFWAPEISEWKGHYYIYYVAHKRGGPLSVAVATADKPQGPWTDHGPLVSQEDGSIDPMAVADENGERWLVWKEDGNSRRLPTPLWAQKLNEEGTQLIGERHELFHNDVPWEGGLVEGPFVLKHGDWFYLFYSGNGCCGRGCTYAMGVARSKKLLGPWEKNPGNPILGENASFKCPGHGSIVQDAKGRYFLLYHAYDAHSFTATGREMMLDEVKFNADGWPSINDGKGPSMGAPSPLGAAQRHAELVFNEDFKKAALQPGWQWPVAFAPMIKSGGGHLTLTAAVGKHAVLARSTTSGDFAATTTVDLASLKPGVSAGLAAYGDPANTLGISINKDKVRVWQLERNKQKTLAETESISGNTAHLRVTATDGSRFEFAYSADGRDWKKLGPQADGSSLPPWDRNIRVVLSADGTEGAEAQFDSLHIEPTKPRFAAPAK